MNEFEIENVPLPAVKKTSATKNKPALKQISEEEFYFLSLDNKYKIYYKNIIERARFRILEGYCEKHHVVPKCLGGSNVIENLVKLTAEEHFVVHQLLVKMFFDNKKLIYAANMMCVGKDSDCKRPNNKQYKWLKIKLNKIHKEYRPSEETKLKIGEKSKGRFVSEETRLKISKAGKGRKNTPEHIEKLAASRRGKPSKIWTEEDKLKHSLLMKGKPKSEATKAKMKIARGLRIISEETKIKISNSLKGRISINIGRRHSEEARKNMSLGQLKRQEKERELRTRSLQ